MTSWTLALTRIREWVEEREGRVVRVTFTDPYWWRRRRPQEPPMLEVFGRLGGGVTDDGFDIIALDLVKGPRAYAAHAAEGQFVLWPLVVEIHELQDSGSAIGGA